MYVSSDYRYQMYSETGTQTLQATRSDFDTPVSLAQDKLRWDFGIHTLDTVVTFVPLASLSFRAGVRFLKEDIVRKTNGAIDAGTQRTWSYSPLFSAAWIPNKRLSVRGEFESRVSVDPYVRISPENTVGSSIRTRFYFNDKWGVDDTLSFRNLKTEDIGFVAHSRNNATALWYQPLEKLGFQGGFTYGHFSSKNSIGFLQGIPPLKGLLSTDQTIDRIYSLGVKINP